MIYAMVNYSNAEQEEEMKMQEHTLSTPTGDHVFTGRIIGAGTSEAAHHNHTEDFLSPRTPDGTERRRKCSACRWLETTLYRTEDKKYVVHTIGRSIVPGEIDYIRVTFTTSAYEMVEILTVKSAREPYIPDPSARALAQAAELYDDVQEAYVNRAVVR
jgi:hypothetical protein